MKKLLAAAIAAQALAMPAFAQDATVFANQDTASDNVDAIEDSARDGFRNAAKKRRFGLQGKRMGWYGSLAATASGATGNTETLDVGIGARFGHFDGTNAHDVVLSYQYGEASGVRSDDALSASYEYSRFFNSDFYAYGKLATVRDDFASYTQDDFIGAGLGYRVVNTGNTVWALQAGPGYRIQEASTGARSEGGAWAIGSKFSTELSDNAFLSNDTSLIGSKNDTLVVNDLGVNVYLSGPLALRTSLVTTYHSDPLPGRKDIDNKLGLSLVYTFK